MLTLIAGCAYIVIGLIIASITLEHDDTTQASAGCLVFTWPVVLTLALVMAAVVAAARVADWGLQWLYRGGA